MRRTLLWLGLVATLAAPGTALADARVVTGRTPAAEDRSAPGAQPSRWSLDLGAGVAAAGDLFQVVASQTVLWDTPRSGSFPARRYDVTLDEDVLIQGGLALALTPRGSLRLSLQWTEMDLTALANDSQYVTPVLWDRARFLRGALLWEQRLTETRLRPYVVLGLGATSLDATADGLDQTRFTPLAGAGAVLSLGDRLALRLEALDGVQQLSSTDLLGDLLPQDTDLRERGPQHVVSLTAGLRLTF